VFESSADASAAAKRVYLRYLQIGREVSEDGGRGVGRFNQVLTESALREEKAGAKLLQTKKLVSTGATELTGFKLQRANLATGEVAAYACIDLSNVRVMTSAGKDVTPKGRPARQTVRPTFVWKLGRLMVEANGTWSGSTVC
jgi:hypothetical protein